MTFVPSVLLLSSNRDDSMPGALVSSIQHKLCRVADVRLRHVSKRVHLMPVSAAVQSHMTFCVHAAGKLEQENGDRIENISFLLLSLLIDRLDFTIRVALSLIYGESSITHQLLMLKVASVNRSSLRKVQI